LVAEAVARQLASNSEREPKAGNRTKGFLFFLRGVNGKGRRNIDMIQRAIESKRNKPRTPDKTENKKDPGKNRATVVRQVNITRIDGRS
jgi:hypothetical protein